MHEVIGVNISERIHNIIDDRDMKQRTLADKLDIPYSTLSGYMTGSNRFPLDIIVKIAQELNVTSDYLLSLVDEPERPLKLSQSEQRMIAAYRTLSRDQRELIAQNIRFMQEQNQK